MEDWQLELAELDLYTHNASVVLVLRDVDHKEVFLPDRLLREMEKLKGYVNDLTIEGIDTWRIYEVLPTNSFPYRPL